MQITTHNFGATYQEGIVVRVDVGAHRVKCRIPALEDFETAWLPYLTPNAGGNQFYCLPDVGELVALLLDARGEGGCVLGAIFNEQDLPPENSGNMWTKKFTNGTVISHNRTNGNIVVSTKGVVTVTAPQVIINGDVVVNGKMHATGEITSGSSVSAPIVRQGSIELGSHKHIEQGDGRETSKAIS